MIDVDLLDPTYHGEQHMNLTVNLVAEQEIDRTAKDHILFVYISSYPRISLG